MSWEHTRTVPYGPYESYALYESYVPYAHVFKLIKSYRRSALFTRRHVSAELGEMPQRPCLSMFARQRAKHLLSEGSTCARVVCLLREEGVFTTHQTVWRLERHIRAHNRIEPLPKSGRPTRLSAADLQAIDAAMERNDETTGKEIVALLERNRLSVSKRMVYRARRKLGWTSWGAAYCQLIRAPNRVKRLEWARENLGATFEHVIWSDETTVQLQTHRRFCCRKKGRKPRYKPRPKHPVKLHVWAGISWRGPTRVCIFEGTMDANLYVTILENYLLPFIRTEYPSYHQFMQDNDPKHTSRRARDFFEEHNINWWRTPPGSPDANPIENLWHELKVCTLVIIF